MKHTRRVLLLLTASITIAGSPVLVEQAFAAAAKQAPCVAKADSEGMKGGMRRAYMRECTAGQRLDQRRHKGPQKSGHP